MKSARMHVARAATRPERYDHASELQREVSRRMSERLDYVKLHPAIVVDAGSGSGYALARLMERFPEASVLAVDALARQLRRAEHASAGGVLTGWLRRLVGARHATAIVADFRRLPLAAATVGCVWSNLALHWVNDPSSAFVEWHRVLDPEGLVLFSTFGPDTLKELRAAWAAADRAVGRSAIGSDGAAQGSKADQRVHQFVDMHDIGDMLIHSGFADPVMDMETITLTYRDVDALLADLRGTGSTNAHRNRPRGLTGRSRWQAMREAYETMRRDGTLPATFEVVYGHAWKPKPRARPAADGVAIVRVEDIVRPGRAGR